MSKTIEELNQIKQECESMSIKLKELSDDELKIVTGGGSVASVKVEEFKRTTTANILEMLQVKIVGVDIVVD